MRAAEEPPAADASAKATLEQVSAEIVAKTNVSEPVAPAQQQSVKLAQQAAERPSALEVQQQKGVSLMVRAEMCLVCPLVQCRPISSPMTMTQSRQHVLLRCTLQLQESPK